MRAPISVVIPTFNRAPLIPETLDRVLGQTTPPSEVIVVDDGSVDDTEAVVAKFGNAVRYIKIPNDGPPNARTVGVAAATQTWVALCDSDDLWHADYVRGIMALAAAAPQCQFIFSNFSLVTDGVWSPVDKFSQAPEGWWKAAAPEPLGDGMQIARASLYAPTVRYQLIVPSAMSFTRRFFDAIGGCNPAFGRNKSEDTEFVLRCVREPPTGILTRPLVGLRRHVGNFSGDKFAVCLGRLEIIRFALENHDLTDEWRNALVAERSKLSVEAFDGAFEHVDMHRTRLLADSIPPHAFNFRRRLKKAIAFLPPPINRQLTRWIQRERVAAR